MCRLTLFVFQNNSRLLSVYKYLTIPALNIQNRAENIYNVLFFNLKWKIR